MDREPPRWIEDPELDDGLREELAAAAAQPPPALDLDAGHARLAAAIAAEPGGGGPGGDPPAGPGGAGPWIAGGAAVVAALIGIGAWVSLGSESAVPPSSAQDPDTTRTEPPIAPPSPVDVEVPNEVQAPVEIEPPDPVEAPAAPALDEPDLTPAPRRGARRGAPEEAEGPSANALREEMLLLQRARRALPQQPRRALALAEEGNRRFSTGVFGQEREGIAVLAALRLETAGATARARRYLRGHPQGSMSDRVRAALESP